MIQPYTNNDLDAILSVINDGAQAHRGIIPDDCWQEPDLPVTEMR